MSRLQHSPLFRSKAIVLIVGLAFIVAVFASVRTAAWKNEPSKVLTVAAAINIFTNTPTPTMTGTPSGGCGENFDGVVTPALPVGWSSTATGSGIPWETSHWVTANTPPNTAVASAPATVGNTELFSPIYSISPSGGAFSFRMAYGFEISADGMVLEISIDGGAYQDILAAGGGFSGGGYTGTINQQTSPLYERAAWTGSSASTFTIVVLPAAANGHNIQLKWRVATDEGQAGTGAWIDTIIGIPCATGETPTNTPTATLTPTSTTTNTPTPIPSPFPEYDLTISQSASPDPVFYNWWLTYTLTVTNSPAALGGGACPNVRFGWPTGVPFNFTSASGTNGYVGTVDSGGVTFTGGCVSSQGGVVRTATLTVVLTMRGIQPGVLTSLGSNVIVDPENNWPENNEVNNTAATIQTTYEIGGTPIDTRTPTSTNTPTPTNTATNTPTPAGSPISVSLPNLTAVQQVTVPMEVGDLTGRGVTSYKFHIAYAGHLVGSGGVSKTGTLSSGMTVTETHTTGQNVGGHLIVTATSTTPLSGSGTLINLIFHSWDNAVFRISALEFQDYTDPGNVFHPGFRFNDGDPPAVTTNGSIVLLPPPPPTWTATNTATLTPTATSTPTGFPSPFPELDLRISQADSPDPVIVGQPLTYTLTVINDPTPIGNPACPNVRFTYPTGVSFVFNSTSGTNGYNAVPDVNGITFTGGCLSSIGGTATATLTVVIIPTNSGTLTSPGSGVIVDPENHVHETNETNNTAQTITTTVTTATPTNTPTPTATVTYTPTTTPSPSIYYDLSISQSDSPDPAGVDQDLTYTLLAFNTPWGVHNPGGFACPNVRFDYPSGVPFVFVSATGTDSYSGTADAGGVTFSGGCISSLGGVLGLATLTVVIRPLSPGTLTSLGSSVVVDPENLWQERFENNNTAQTMTTTVITPTPTNTPTPTQNCTTERVNDGTFEAGTPWPAWTVQTSTQFGTPLCDLASCGTGSGTAPPFQGNNWAWFGSTDLPETASLGQNVTIPAGTAALGFQMRIGAVSAPFTDTLVVTIDGTQVATFSEPSVAEPGYTLRTFDVSAFADGGQHALLFRYTGPTTGAANFVVDNVSITSSLCATPTNTATPTPTFTPTSTPTPPLRVSVTIDTNPPDLAFSVDSVTYNSEQTFIWSGGSSHTISAISPQMSPDEGIRYVWSSWSDFGEQTHTIAPTSNAFYRANFSLQYQLKMLGQGVSPPTGYHNPGMTVPIFSAVPSGCKFNGWQGFGNGSYTGLANPATVVMNGPITQHANIVCFPPGTMTPTPTATPTPTIPPITVNSTNDPGNGVCDAGECTLREAIAAVNDNGPSQDFIVFDGAVFGTAQIIDLQSALPDVNWVTIDGPGVNLLTVRRAESATVGFRVFTITGNSSSNVSISGMTISNGHAEYGGGIASHGSTLSLTNVHLKGNIATISGGGIYLNAFFNPVNGFFSGCTISGNTALQFGGGGIAYYGETGSNLRIVNSTISSNTILTGTGGGIMHLSMVYDSTLEIVNSTIAGNSAGFGGGIYTFASAPGDSATTKLRNTIIADNTPNSLTASPQATYVSQGFNLTNDDGGGFLHATGDKINASARLAPLANYGGTTPTHALLFGSDALDAGNNAGSGVSTDQRGLNRTIDLAGITNATDGTDIGSYEAQSLPSRATFDYDGDGKTDISVFRPADGAWYLQQSTAGPFGMLWGFGSDKITPADYDGDGKTDIAVYRPSDGIWYVYKSSDGTVSYYVFGLAEDLPTPADYDGDGKADVSVFRPSTGTWYRQNSSDGSFFGVQFGATEDKPTVGDFDGDGKSDIAVFRPSTGAWYRINSSDGSLFGELFGFGSDVLVPADYDGDRKTDLAVFRPSNGMWYMHNSSNYYDYKTFGLESDIPAPGDFDGDGKADLSVFRPSDGHWYRHNSSNAQFVALHFGTNGDKPTMTAFRY